MTTPQPGDRVQLSETFMAELLRHRLLSRSDLGAFTVLRTFWRDVLEIMDEEGCKRLMHRDNLVLVLDLVAA